MPETAARRPFRLDSGHSDLISILAVIPAEGRLAERNVIRGVKNQNRAPNMNKPATLTALGLALGILMAPSNGSAVIYDAAADFSLNSNPAGVWSYGYSANLGGAMSLDGENLAESHGLYVWRETGSGQNGPAFAYNPTPNPITISGLTDLSIWNAHQLSASPGSIYFEYSVLRFSAPESGQYQVQGVFSSVDQFYGATTDVHLLRNGISIYDGLLSGGITASASFNQSVLLNAGDTLDFAVGPDGYGGGWDATGIDALVIPVPEPAAASLLLLGLPLARLLSVRTRR